MRTLLLTTATALSLIAPQASAQGILPELMYGVYALDKTCEVNSRRMLVTPTDILIADPGLDIRIAYPDQRTLTSDEIGLQGNFFVSVLYDGVMRKTADGAVMSFNFPDLAFPMLEPILKGVLGDNIPSAIKADLNLVDQGALVSMSLSSDDPTLGKRLAGAVGTWNFDAEKITRGRGDNESVYPRCFGGNTADQQHASLVSADQTGVYSFGGECAQGSEAFIISNDGWGLSIPFADPTIGFAFAKEGNSLTGELYRAPFAPLAPNENSYIDIEVRDGATHHQLAFSGSSFDWTKFLANGESQAAGTYTKCSDVGDKSFAEVVADIDSYLK